ncbi:hypothetical protein [uncultured Gimesia sp.]|uniref:hypothetical protein n=1 Tax=uncultured Gimesia sp. TaxID=1678688 RepID=UPI0030DBD671
MKQVGARLLCWMNVGVCCLFLLGCGTDSTGPERFVLSGQVLHNGQPVPAGQVILMPDTAKGNQGPGAVGTIENGRWHTDPNKGPVSGPHIAMLNGYASTEATVPGGDPPMLFTEFKTEVDVTADASDVDFDVNVKGK